MNIIYLASEAYPFCKTGGLADVMYALPKQMKKLGHNVSVFLPKYDVIPNKYLYDMKYLDNVELNNEIYNLYKYELDDIIYYFIENRTFYERGHIYGDLDEDVQYANFCEIILKFLIKLNLKFDIVHCNDWQTGVFPYFLKTRYNKLSCKIIYTIHNLQYQGRFNNYSLLNLGYNYPKYSINFMQIGIENSDIVNTVSPSYAKEIKYPYFAEGLEDITNSKNILGILNGIDYEYYNPKYTDIFNYKKEKKKKLLEYFNLPNTNDMIICLISRLVEGKGLDLITARIENILKNDSIKFFVLGSGQKEYEEFFQYLSLKYPDKCKVCIGYCEELSLLMYEGSDLFLMPSRYEPCGLAQMIAMRYGTIPLVREIGGLKDTVTPFNEYTKVGNGFSFTNFNADDMLYTIRYAQKIYYDKKEEWNIIVKNCINTDNSWKRASKKYEKIYMN